MKKSKEDRADKVRNEGLEMKKDADAGQEVELEIEAPGAAN